MKKLIGSISNRNSISGAILSIGNISGSLSQPISFTAYEVATANGYVGNEAQWLAQWNGHLPQRGIDYWLKEDIEQMIKKE